MVSGLLGRGCGRDYRGSGKPGEGRKGRERSGWMGEDNIMLRRRRESCYIYMEVSFATSYHDRALTNWILPDVIQIRCILAFPTWSSLPPY